MADAETRIFLAQLRLSQKDALNRLRKALQANGGAVTRTAEALGCSYMALYRASYASAAVAQILDEHGLGREGAAAAARASKEPREVSRAPAKKVTGKG